MSIAGLGVWAKERALCLTLSLENKRETIKQPQQERRVDGEFGGGGRERERSNGNHHRPSISGANALLAAAAAPPPKLFRSTLKAFSRLVTVVGGRKDGERLGIYMNFAFEHIGNSKYAY